jgi:ABC-type nitrate/sulfonate/bicarbonate transport system permease component
VAGVVFLIAVWALAATQFTAVQLPRPALVLQAISDNAFSSPALAFSGLEGGYLANVAYTMVTALVAAAIGGGAGFVVGIAAARSQMVRDLSAPLLVIFGTVPPLVAAPFMLVWFGPGQLAQSAIVAFFCFVIMALTAQNAALALPPVYEELAATLNATPRERLRRIVVPGVIPAVIVAVRICIAAAWSLQCAGELLGSDRGVGRVILLSQQVSYTQGAIAVILLLGVAGLVVESAVVGALRYATRWQEVKSR